MRNAIPILALSLAISPVYGWVLTAGPTTSNLTTTSVTISWTSDTPMPSRVVYGYGYHYFYLESPADPTLRTQHQVTLTNLAPGNLLEYQLLNAESQAAAGTDEFSVSLPAPDPNAPVDYELGTVGTQQLNPGFTFESELGITMLSGQKNRIFLGYSPLPSGVRVEFYSPTGNINPIGFYQPIDQTRPYYYDIYNRNPSMRFTVDASAAAGTYSFKIYTEIEGVYRETLYTLNIVPLPAWSRTPITTIPPLPDLTLWEQNMLSYGQRYCTDPNPDTYEGNVWYYDGQRVYYQIADYTHNPGVWNACAQYAGAPYVSYLIDNNGSSTGWRIFPHGLTMAVDRQNDARAKQAFSLLQNAGIAGLYPMLMRETGYYLQLHTLAASRGLENWEKADFAANALISQFDQIFVSRTNRFYIAFWCALAADALREYYVVRKDARIPVLLKRVADTLWTEAWMPRDYGFFYGSVDGRSGGTPDLNLLYASLYAWVWAASGEDSYRQKADLLFEKGVTNGYLGNGKHFSQNYRLSFNYVQWRTDPESISSVPITQPALTSPATTLRIFPNPWKATQHASRPITFDSFNQPGTLRIFTVSGHLIQKLSYTPPSTTWDLRNQHGDRLASGIYLYVLEGIDGSEKRGKLAIVR